MRIARIIEYFPPHIGGMEGHGLTLSFEQIKLGYDVEVFIGYGGNWEDPKKWGRLVLGKNIYKAPFQFLSPYSKVRRFWFNFWAFKQVKKRHKKNPYGIIHIHGDFIESYFGGKLSKKLGVPAVITIHAGLNKRLLKPKNAWYFKNISKIICVSEEIAGDLEKIGVPKEKIIVISSGVYLIEFADVDENKIFELRNQYGKPILISVGVLRISKGLKYLIEAYKVLKKWYPHLTLLILGDGPEYDNLKIEAESFSHIYFLGRKNLNKHEEVMRYLKAADVFVSSSIDLPQDREGTPTSIMEAMAAGLPVVATRVGGSPYLIKDSINGFLVSPKSTEELEEVIAKLINNPDLAKKMGEKNLEDIKQKDWSIIIEKINEVYKSVLHIS